MNTGDNTHPQRTNNTHFSTEQFPEVIAFCDRDESTHIKNGEDESYTYLLNGKARYTLKKGTHQWELVELYNNAIIRVSTGRNLAMALQQGLRFTDADKARQEELVSIIFPVKKEEMDQALALMYYYGGYPGSFLQMTPELSLIIEHFVSPDVTFLSYSYVPVQYVEWLREQLKNTGVIQSGAAKTLWMYKK